MNVSSTLLSNVTRYWLVRPLRLSTFTLHVGSIHTSLFNPGSSPTVLNSLSPAFVCIIMGLSDSCRFLHKPASLTAFKVDLESKQIVDSIVRILFSLTDFS